MTPEQLVKAGIRMYGRRHWKRDMATNLGLDYTTVHRWSTLPADTAIPARIEVCILALLERYKQIQIAERIRREHEARANHRYRGKDTFRKHPRKRRMAHVAASQDDPPDSGGADGGREEA